MQNSEKLCLKWNDFQENLNSAFGGLRNDQDFADVTLVSEDGTQIETHKVILASSSPFFMDILGLVEELRLKGLTGSSEEGHAAEEEFLNNEVAREKNIEERKHCVKNIPDAPKPMNVFNSNASSSVALVSVEADQLDEQKESMMKMT